MVGRRCGPGREQGAEAAHEPLSFCSPSLAAQSRHTHASAPRRAKRRTPVRSCSLPVRNAHVLSRPRFCALHRPPTQHARHTHHVPLKTLAARKSCPSSRRPPRSPSQLRQTAHAAHHRHPKLHRFGSRVDSQHRSSRWHPTHLLERRHHSMFTKPSRGDWRGGVRGGPVRIL